MQCPHLHSNRCLLAEAIAGIPCEIKAWLCEKCGAKATPQMPTPEVVTLARHSVFLAGNSEMSGRIGVEYGNIVTPAKPARSLCKHLGTPQREAMCSGCGGGKVAQVFMCNLLGRECTLTPSDGTQDGEPVEFCSTCELWEEEE